jgi:hypothetical protein
MKTCIPILIIVVLSASPFTSAEHRTSNDLNTLLRDASYIFNRFEEMSAGVQREIDTNYPDQIKKNSKEALSAVLGNVETEKPALNAVLGHSKVSSTELLDVYAELVEVVSELNSDATNVASWGDQKLAMDLAQLGAKATILSARVGITLRSQIAAQELQLASCTQKTSSHK